MYLNSKVLMVDICVAAIASSPSGESLKKLTTATQLERAGFVTRSSALSTARTSRQTSETVSKVAYRLRLRGGGRSKP